MATVSSGVYAQISLPASNILDSLVNLTRERSWDLTSVIGNTFNTQSAARVPSKPFIIGFIPPDIPVNYQPPAISPNGVNNQATAITAALKAIPAGPTPLAGP